MSMLANVAYQWRYRVTNFWLVPTCGLCNNPSENNGYCGQHEAKKVIDVLQVHLDNFVNSFFRLNYLISLEAENSPNHDTPSSLLPF